MKIEGFLKLKTVKRVISKFGDIPSDRYDMIESILLKYYQNVKLRDIYEHIAELCINAPIEEIDDAIINKMETGNRGTISEKYMASIWGEAYGKILYDIAIDSTREHRKITSSKEYRAKSHTSIGAYEEFCSNMSKANWEIRRNSGEDFRESCVTCREYYISRGYADEAEIESLLYIEKQKSWVYKFSEFDKKLVSSKRVATLARNREAGIYPKKSRASKWADRFFSDVIKKLPTHVVDDIITNCITGTEYWIRDIDDANKYYFVDFCIPNLLAIEYNGMKYHPKSIDDANYLFGIATKDQIQDKYELDMRKAKSIKEKFTHYHEVWSDDADVNRTVDWIMEIINDKTQPLDE